MRDLIPKIGFLTSIISYGLFGFFEYLRPGFVSYVFSLHWLLIPIIGFGIWWVIVYERPLDSPKGSLGMTRWVWYIVQSLIGILLMIILWREGEVFGDFRIIVSIIGFILPFVIYKLTR